MRIEALTGEALDAALDDVAGLRIRVFRDWPYLYDGDLAYERDYLETYRTSDAAILVGAFDGDRLVGAATGTPMADHAGDFAAAFDGTGLALSEIFYCAESVLLPEYRGRGIGHRFFDLRESHARALGAQYCAFCGVVRPGEEILQIIPLDEELFVEARVPPEDIANIRRGQEATVKLSAYDYTIYGTLKARVDFISADTFKDNRVRESEQDPFYKVTLRVDMAALTDRQAQIEIRPGMQAQVELHTGERTVLQYLVKPLYKSREALRER